MDYIETAALFFLSDECYETYVEQHKFFDGKDCGTRPAETMAPVFI